MTDDLERRTVAERRKDPNAWTPAHRTQVKMLYGFIVGGLLISAGVGLLMWAVITTQMSKIVMGLSGSLILLGLVAGMPGTFMPILSYVIKRVPFLKSTEPTPNEIAAIAGVIDLVPEDTDEG